MNTPLLAVAISSSNGLALGRRLSVDSVAAQGVAGCAARALDISVIDAGSGDASGVPLSYLRVRHEWHVERTLHPPMHLYR
ncbi:MAG: hypothetical protein V4582_06450 [Pseudomonadota bacterium]